MRTSLERALNGRDLADLAMSDQSDVLNGLVRMGVEDYESGLVDALTNLMHFARRYEIDFNDAIRLAEFHHDYESNFKWTEVPE